MTRLERYREQLAKLEAKRNMLMRTGRYVNSVRLNQDIIEIEKCIREAEEYEESCRPKPLKEILSEEELHEMGIIPLMIECHLAADFLTGIAYEIVDICKKHGLSDITFMPDLKDLIEKSEMFASFLTKISPELRSLVVNNETLNNALHKKCINYIGQRLK